MLGATGRPVVGTGVFLDVRSIWALPRYAEYVQEMLTQITEYLFQHQIDFDFIDDDALAAARVEHGKIRIGRALYDQIVIPKFANLAPEAEARRKRLVAAGCTVLTQEELGYIQPTLAVTVLGPNESAIRVRKHSLGQGEALYFVYNNSAETSIFTLSPKERFPVARCDSETGRLEAIRGTHGVWGYDIPPYRMEVFLVGKAAANAEKPQLVPETVKLTLTDGWKMRPVRRISVGKDDFVEETLRGGAKRGKLGDWAALVGSEYSGDIVYTIDFQAPRGARYLDLGKVGYCAEVKLNGKALGTRLFEPYWFALGEALQKGTNHLEVRVTNTLANAILAKGVWERWKKELPYEWPYEVMERDYEKESIPSGLFGPVTIR
jgi:hypothetical protein